MSLKSIIKTGELYIRKNSPAILTTIGIVAGVTATILAVKAKADSEDVVEEEKENKAELDEKFTIIDEAKVAWKYYIPTAIATTASITCIISAHRINVSRELAYLAALTASNCNLKKLKERIIESCNEDEQKKIFKRVDDISKIEPIRDIDGFTQVGGNGLYLCYDEMFGRYFKSDINTIRAAVNEINRRMRDEMKMSLNELYLELGLDTITIGDELGWNIDQGYIEVNFDSTITQSGVPVIVMNYQLGPLYNYGLEGCYGM